MLAPEQTSPQAIKYKQTVKRLKTTMCMHSWGKLWTRYKKKNRKPNCHFQRARSKSRNLGAKAGYYVCPLHSTPPKGRANDLSHPSTPTAGHIPTFTPYKGISLPLLGRKHGKLLLVFIPHCYNRAPNKALPKFLVWLLINFY